MKKDEFMKTHTQNLPATANRSCGNMAVQGGMQTQSVDWVSAISPVDLYLINWKKWTCGEYSGVEHEEF